MIKALLRVLSTPEEPDELRLAALTTLQQCSVQVAEFRPYMADFIAALRTATGSELAELREQAMDILALHSIRMCSRSWSTACATRTPL